MTERGILFSAPMVRALLDGTKTQTRRVCKPAQAANLSYVTGIQDPRDFGQRPLEVRGSGWFGDEDGEVQFRSPYGRPGDRLWVREAWQYADWTEEGLPFVGYSADGAKQIAHYVQNDSDGWGERLQNIWAELSRIENYAIDGRAADRHWRPSIHMPRWASRILLEIVSVRVERLQDISEADAIAEGCSGYRPDDDPFRDVEPRDEYRELWESINGAGSWDANPWVWVVEFRRIES